MESVENKEGESDLFQFMDNEIKKDSTSDIKEVFVQDPE